MQVIDVLGDEQELARPFGLEAGQRPMRGIGFDFGELRAPRIVKFMYERGVAREGLRRRDILDTMTFPQAVLAPKSRQSAFGGNACAGQNHDS